VFVRIRVLHAVYVGTNMTKRVHDCVQSRVATATGKCHTSSLRVPFQICIT